MKRAAWYAAAVVTVFPAALVLAQTPDFSGTWKLEPTRSHITSAAALAGLIRSGAPVTLHVTHPANGTLVIESQINESHSRIYRPGGKSSTPGLGVTITMTSRWDGRTLVSEGTQESTSGASIKVKEVIALSADARTLTIDVTTTGPGDTIASTLVYTRSPLAEPCHNWPTPCKTFSR